MGETHVSPGGTLWKIDTLGAGEDILCLSRKFSSPKGTIPYRWCQAGKVGGLRGETPMNTVY